MTPDFLQLSDNEGIRYAFPRTSIAGYSRTPHGACTLYLAGRVPPIHCDYQQLLAVLNPPVVEAAGEAPAPTTLPVADPVPHGMRKRR